MLTAILILISLIFWVGMLFVYFRQEITAWFDNRYGPDHKEIKPKGKPFWRLYD